MSGIQKIQTLLQSVKRYYALSVHLDDEQQVQLYGLFIREEANGDFFVEDRFGPGTIEDFVKRNNNYPVLVNFEGSQIVSKNTIYQKDYLKTVLFRATIDDFYIYETVVDNQVFVSFSRKNMIDPILNAFAKADFQVIRFTLGPFIATILTPYLPKETETLLTKKLSFNISGWNNDLL